MRIGDKLFIFDINKRVYPPGPGFHPPIYREHFVPVEVIGETSRSWVIGRYRQEDFKAPKRDPFSKSLYTAEMVEDQCWKHDKIHQVISDLRQADGATVRAVAALIAARKVG